MDVLRGPGARAYTACFFSSTSTPVKGFSFNVSSGLDRLGLIRWWTVLNNTGSRGGNGNVWRKMGAKVHRFCAGGGARRIRVRLGVLCRLLTVDCLWVHLEEDIPLFWLLFALLFALLFSSPPYDRLVRFLHHFWGYFLRLRVRGMEDTTSTWNSGNGSATFARRRCGLQFCTIIRAGFLPFLIISLVGPTIVRRLRDRSAAVVGSEQSPCLSGSSFSRARDACGNI